MSELTTNYNLVKPGYADTADIMDINGNMDIIDGVMKEVSDKTDTNTSNVTTLQEEKQNITDNSLTTADKTVPGAINELVDQSAITRFHGEGSSSISMSGSLATVGEWIKSNFIVNRFIFAKITPTDSSGYFGSSSFTVLANCSSANYGSAQLMSDNPNKSAMVVGQLVGGTWYWKTVNTTAIS